jgi:penicillin-binding protein 1A
MRTSVARRQRHRRLGGRRPRSNAAVQAVALAIPLFMFATLLVAGFLASATAVAAYTYLSRDLADPSTALNDITFTSQTVVYDRTGEVTLAHLGDDRRDVVTFAEIPPALIDATTSIEDKTFWDNAGFDPAGFVSAMVDTLSGKGRGGSTITQQLVRDRLLPQSAFSGSVYERKAKEIIQSIRLTQAYPGVAGKKAIMEKYLNENFYGNRSYGIGAAARSYFGKPLAELSLSELAILAGIPQSPTAYDLVTNASEQTVTDANGKEVTQLVVPQDSPIVQRRNTILEIGRAHV